MNKRDNPVTFELYKKHNPWVLLLITLGVTMVGFQFIGAFVGFAIAVPFYPGGLREFIEAILDPTSDEGMRVPLLIMQGTGSLLGFIVMPWLLLKFYYRGSASQFIIGKVSLFLVLQVMFITLFFMVVNTPFIEWNEHVRLPEALSGFEKVVRAMEDSLAVTSAFITKFENIGQLILGIFVVAIIPGIGEELVFRGLVQNHIYRISGNVHVAIWLAALLFSIFHLQFYGLVPRMLLGVLFGYLYFFSGNIIYPMVAHFFNNGFTLVMLYLYQQNLVTYNIEDAEIFPWPQVILSAVVIVILFVMFWRRANYEELGKGV